MKELAMSYFIFSRFGETANLIIGGGPQASASVSSPPSGTCSRSTSSVTNPTPYFHPSSGRFTWSMTYHTLSLSGYSAAHRSSSSRRRMSSSVRFAYTRCISVVSSGWSRSTDWMTWYMGVIPLPPAIIASRRAFRGLPLMTNSPRPVYSTWPSGPLTSM
ncbi:Os08g0468801 [Oryza sativa Japonica Group]|uniref:Os08g0468200 protein n=1 Tax=Oryza sativa subsp. japonica TaxID=39947 RepID=A0A0P0XGL4_ORYSJ|nr:hypothetical protein EE612_044809 [Oryza sativa]BAT05817.1 Os08g0468200 [Oryza sativa Japonica Group]BAT05821.1 Os08g0468801 [Oryza sativa Japonica Group]